MPKEIKVKQDYSNRYVKELKSYRIIGILINLTTIILSIIFCVYSRIYYIDFSSLLSLIYYSLCLSNKRKKSRKNRAILHLFPLSFSLNFHSMLIFFSLTSFSKEILIYNYNILLILLISIFVCYTVAFVLMLNEARFNKNNSVKINTVVFLIFFSLLEFLFFGLSFSFSSVFIFVNLPLPFIGFIVLLNIKNTK